MTEAKLPNDVDKKNLFHATVSCDYVINFSDKINKEKF